MTHSVALDFGDSTLSSRLSAVLSDAAQRENAWTRALSTSDKRRRDIEATLVRRWWWWCPCFESASLVPAVAPPLSTATHTDTFPHPLHVTTHTAICLSHVLLPPFPTAFSSLPSS